LLDVQYNVFITSLATAIRHILPKKIDSIIQQILPKTGVYEAPLMLLAIISLHDCQSADTDINSIWNSAMILVIRNLSEMDLGREPVIPITAFL